MDESCRENYWRNSHPTKFVIINFLGTSTRLPPFDAFNYFAVNSKFSGFDAYMKASNIHVNEHEMARKKTSLKFNEELLALRKTSQLTVCRYTNNKIAVNLWLVINIEVVNERDGLRDFTLLDRFHFAFTSWKNFYFIVTVTFH